MRKIYLFLLALCVSGVSSIATAQKFPVNFSLDEKVTGRLITGVTLQPQKSGIVYGDLQTIVVNEGITPPTQDNSGNIGNYNIYNDVTDSGTLVVKAGQTVKPGFGLINSYWDGAWMHGYVYVDGNQDGQLSSPDELLSTSFVDNNGNWVTQMPEFRVPTTVGTYTMRYKIDWASTDPAGGSQVVSAHGSVTDATMQVVAPTVTINYDNTKGSIEDNITQNPICGEQYMFRVTPNPGLYASATVICGTQETLLVPDNMGYITIPAAVFQNDLTINVEFGKRVFTADDAANGICYFRLKNKQHGTYLKSGVSTASSASPGYVDEGTVYVYTWDPTDATEANKQASYIWKFEVINWSTYLVSQGYRMDAIGDRGDGYSITMSTTGSSNVMARQSGDTYGFTSDAPGYSGVSVPYLHAVNFGRGHVDGAQKFPDNAEGYHVTTWTEGADASQWYIEPVEDFTTTIGTGGWSSINYAFPVSLPAASVTAYTVASEGDGFVELAEIPATDGEILLPRNTPAFIEGTEGETVTVTILLEEPKTTIAKAEGFKGTTLTETKELAATEAVYGIATVEGVTALYKMQSGTTISCNKAYYETTASGVAKFELNFGETTGIDTLAPDPSTVKDNTLYDLNGRRVLYPTRGIYVTASGRKIYVK